MANRNDCEAEPRLTATRGIVSSWLRPGPLAAKLVVYSMIAAMGLGIIVALIQVAADYRRENDRLEIPVNRLLVTAKPSAGYAVLALDRAAALQVLEGLLNTEYVVSGRLVDEGGEELAYLAKPEQSPEQGGADLAELVAGGQIEYQISLQDPRDGESGFGMISIEVDRVSALHSFFDRAILVVTFGMMRNVLLALLMLMVFYYFLTQPLVRFVRSLSSIDPKNPDSADLEVSEFHKDTELGLLATTTRQLIEESQRYMLSMEVAQSSSTAKSMFLANMSHELRTPLTAILGYSDLLSRGSQITGEQREKLDVINRSGRHLLAVINDVLDMSKIEAGRMTLHERPFDLHAAVADVVEMLHSRAQLKGLEVITEVAPDLPRHVLGDGGKIRQILTNLIANAVNHTRTGTVTLRARAREAAKLHAGKAQHLLVLEVEDTGSGIAAEDIETIFESFSQLARPTGKTKGTGLGLSISRNFARLMGGDLKVSSALGRGSAFTVTVPITISVAPEAQGLEQKKVVGGKPDQPRRHVLVVDDDPDCRAVMVELLSLFNCESTQAQNGQEAVALFKELSPELVLMDARMPVMNGFEATRQIKATSHGRGTPSRQ